MLSTGAIDVAFQKLMPGNGCFGCGPENPDGLRIESFWKSVAPDAEAVCTYVPHPHQSAGPPQWLNGGIVSVLIDCHSVCTAVADAYRREGRAMGEEPLIWYVTGRLSVDYLRPTPIDRPVDLTARVTAVEGKKTTVACRLESDGVVCAQGEVLAIRVSESWRG